MFYYSFTMTVSLGKHCSIKNIIISIMRATSNSPPSYFFLNTVLD